MYLYPAIAKHMFVFFYTVDGSISPASLKTFVIHPTSVSEQNISKTATAFSTSNVIHTIMPAHTTEKQSSKDTGRKFDGLSFFGGMILGAFICILLLFSVKYYQAKKRSYHSL